MRNKKKSLNFVSCFIVTFFLLMNIVVPTQVATAKTIIKSAAKVTAVKVSASVNNKTPLQNTTVKVTVVGPVKSPVTIVCYYKSKNTTYKVNTGSKGKVVLPVKISRATKGYAVAVNISLSYKGKVYTTKTSFKPR